MERVKLHSNRNDFKTVYFWRTTGNKPQELDFIGKTGDRMETFKRKLSGSAKAKSRKTFADAYPGLPRPHSISCEPDEHLVRASSPLAARVSARPDAPTGAGLVIRAVFR